jgi:2-C-methyl-D-erythritol 4-phosphate cytidylyltransferase
MAVALIVAAGRGERLGSGRPKALVTVAGRPMLHWSVSALLQVPSVERIVVALPAGALDAAPPGTIGVAGAATRSESVLAAFEAANDGDPVLVHDAARPLATPELFSGALAELERSGAHAVVAAAPVADTIKEVGDDGRTVVRTLSRDRLWAIQTPQVFRREVLAQCLFDATPALLATATDDAWLIEQAGGCVVIYPSSADNLKITTPLDLQVAELLLAERGA